MGRMVGLRGGRRTPWGAGCSEGGSAGSVLRSQGTLGRAQRSRWRARGIRMSTFLCSLRPGPAAALWIGCSMRESDSRRFGMRHRFSKEGLQGLQDLGPSARGLVRHVGRGGAPRGGPAFAGNVSIGRFRAASDEGQDVHVPMLSPALPATARSRPTWEGTEDAAAGPPRGLRPRPAASRDR